MRVDWFAILLLCGLVTTRTLALVNFARFWHYPHAECGQTAPRHGGVMTILWTMIWGRWQFSCLIGVVLLLAAGFFLEAGRVLLGDNLHEVLPGEIYRGAQRSPQDLQKLVKRHGIRTVVNLRGTTNSPWYVEQC